jgi:hypothetical protein
MAEPIRIANCSGFFGDRLSAAAEMVDDGPIDVLTGDWLAELTMLILARIRAKRPGAGYAGTFVTQMEQVMGSCLDRGIKVVSNAGGLDPGGCAAAVQEVADRLGLAPSIAYVDGDDLLPRVADLAASGDLQRFDDGNHVAAGLGVEVELGDVARFVSANAYLGCWGIVEALTRGADIVITGRVTDAAVVCGPAAWHHGWGRSDFDQLAGAVVAGHLIECSGQVTGGNYSFFTEVPGFDRVGFPWADVHEDGSSVIGKHDGTGGLVSVGTVTSQLLYEVGGPRYYGPDVTSRFDTVQLEQVGRDRVRVFGVNGEPPPATLKVAMNSIGGHRNHVSVALTGLDIEAKAAAVEAALWRACPFQPSDYANVTTRLIRSDHPDANTNESATAELRITVKDPDARKVGRAFTNAMVETVLCNIPGMYALSGAPGEGSPYGVYLPATVPASLVPQRVTVGGATTHVSSMSADTQPIDDTMNDATSAMSAMSVAAAAVERASSDSVRRVPLGAVIGARSGDKGGNANLGVFARSDEAFVWLAGFLTVERLKDLLPETADLPVDRYELANVRALNFVIRGLLQEGVAASTRVDGQAKSLGEWLRARHVDIPESLLTT